MYEAKYKIMIINLIERENKHLVVQLIKLEQKTLDKKYSGRNN